MGFCSLEFSMKVKCLNEELAQIIAKTLAPENEQVDSQTEITMKIERNILTIYLKSNSSVSTIRNTVDDIISTINTIENVCKTVNSKSNI